MARPTKCTPEVTTVVADAVRQGMYAESAAQLAGIGERTYYTWMQRGEQGEDPFQQFRHAVKKAEAEAEAEAVSVVRGAADRGTWQAAAWYLERKFPSKWGRRQHVEHSGPHEGPITLAGLADLMEVSDENGPSSPS